LLYRSESGQAAYFPTEWTDQAARNPFVELADGNALARPKDLLELSAIVVGLANPGVKENAPRM
jgi:hypothetical protein